jgi:hypothetical protein
MRTTRAWRKDVNGAPGRSGNLGSPASLAWVYNLCTHVYTCTRASVTHVKPCIHGELARD